MRSKTNTYIKTPVRGDEPVFLVTGRKEDVLQAKKEIMLAADHFTQIRVNRKTAINNNQKNEFKSEKYIFDCEKMKEMTKNRKENKTEKPLVAKSFYEKTSDNDKSLKASDKNNADCGYFSNNGSLKSGDSSFESISLSPSNASNLSKLIINTSCATLTNNANESYLKTNHIWSKDFSTSDENISIEKSGILCDKNNNNNNNNNNFNNNDNYYNYCKYNNNFHNNENNTNNNFSNCCTSNNNNSNSRSSSNSTSSSDSSSSINSSSISSSNSSGSSSSSSNSSSNNNDNNNNINNNNNKKNKDNIESSNQTSLLQQHQITKEVRVPFKVVGLVVGPKGTTIKRIQEKTHTYIVTPGRDREPVFEIIGCPENVQKAKKEIESYISSRTKSFSSNSLENSSSFFEIHKSYGNKISVLGEGETATNDNSIYPNYLYGRMDDKINNRLDYGDISFSNYLKPADYNYQPFNKMGNIMTNLQNTTSINNDEYNKNFKNENVKNMGIFNDDCINNTKSNIDPTSFNDSNACTSNFGEIINYNIHSNGVKVNDMNDSSTNISQILSTLSSENQNFYKNLSVPHHFITLNEDMNRVACEANKPYLCYCCNSCSFGECASDV